MLLRGCEAVEAIPTFDDEIALPSARNDEE